MSLRSQIATQPLQRAAEAGFIELPPMSRVVEIVPGSIDDVAGTVDVVASAGATVRRYGWLEEFDERLNISDETVDLRRLNSGAPVLDTHSWYGGTNAIRGITVPGSARIVDGKVVERLKVDRDLVIDGEAVGAELWRKIRAGFVRFLSIGYDARYKRVRAKDRTDGVNDVDLIESEYLNIYETSFVPAGADPEAAVRSAPHGATRRYALRSTEESPMPEPTQTTAAQAAPALDEQAIRAAERKRFAERLKRFEALAASHNLDTAKVRALVESNDNDGEVGLQILEMTHQRQKDADAIKPQPPMVTIGREAGDKMVDAIGIAIAHRGLGSADPEKVRKYEAKLRAQDRAGEILPALDATTHELKRTRLIDLAKQFLRARGIGSPEWSHGQVAEAALAYRAHGGMMTTADFAGLLANTANKLLSVGYSDETSDWREWGIARRLNREDFKQFTMYRRSGAPGLARINEHGEIKRSGWGDSTGLTGQLKTAGVEVAFTRQMLINDDLDAFAQQNLGLGDSAVRFEDDYVMTTILYGNPTLSDSVALFDASRGNLSTDVGTPDIAAITTAGRMFAAMTETIKDPANNNGTTTRKISVQLRGFVCALAESVAFTQILGPRNPDAPTNAVADKFRGLKIFEDARLQVEASAPDVHFAISNRTALVYGGLEGDPSPRLSMQVAAGTDGLIWRLIHDWYCDVEDPKAIIRIPKS